MNQAEKSARVLVVDDEERNRRLLVAMLEAEGYTALEAADGAQALELARRSPPDMVLLDIMMPGMDGYEVVRALKADVATKAIPVVMVTALEDRDSRLRGLEAGAEEFVTKPLDSNELRIRVRNLLRLKEFSDHLEQLVEERTAKLQAEIAERKRIEKEQARLVAIIEATPDFVATGDLDGHALYMNQAGLRMLGYEPGQDVSELRVGEGQPDWALKLVLETGIPHAIEHGTWSGETAFLHRDGHEIPVLQAIIAHGAGDGPVEYLSTIARDITQRRIAEDALKNSQALLNETGKLANVGGWELYIDTKEVVWTEQVYRIHEVELTNKPTLSNAIDFYAPLSKPIIEQAVQRAIEHGEPFDVELEIITAKGNRRWVQSVGKSDREQRRVHGAFQDITERKLAEAQLNESNERLHQISANIHEVFWMTDTVKGEMLYISPAYEAIWGRTVDSLYASPQDWIDAIHIDDRQRILQAALTEQAAGLYDEEYRIVKPDGSICWIHDRASPVRNSDGEVYRVVGVAEDITPRKEYEERIIRLNRLYAVLSGINTTIVRTRDRQDLFEEACRIAVLHGQFRMAWVGLLDADGINLTPAAKAGVEEGYLANMRLSAVADAPDGCPMVARALREGTALFCNDIETDPQMARWREEALRRGYRSIAVLPLQVGERVLGLLLLYASETDFFDREEVALLTELAGDISFALDHLEKEQRLNYLAYYDVLTGLPNRALLYDRLDQAEKAARRNNWTLAVLFVDLDNFKTVNDTLGHTIGDALLQEVAHRLASCLRDTDTVGRLGGDEFAIILPEIGSSEGASMVARKVIESCARPHLIEGHELFVSASVGVTLFPDDAIDSETLIRNADTAMYRAKDLGRNTYQFFTAEMNRNTQGKLQLERDLRYALGRAEFLLHYQPKVSCVSGKITGFEALLRWQHPVRGLVGPDEFIPMLEETGLIVPVGEWVLATACAQTKSWHDAGLGTPSIAVNVSGRQMHVADLCEAVRHALEVSGLAPAYLELELTESQLMKDAEGIIGILGQLKAMGVNLSVDDFGTGYSSLAYLKRFPIDTLKVDRAFVRDIIADPNDVSITRAIITLAHSLKLKVVAEGVETEGQLGLLIANHCDEIQGYYFSRPLPAAQATAMLAAGRSLDSNMMAGLAQRRTLLLVDDEENILSALKRLLRRDGYDILTALGAEQGLELLASHPVDVVISDQRMPGMSGVEFLRRVKTLHPKTVRMVLSGYTDLQAVTDAINEGAIYKFLTKPWDDGILRANIEEAFRNKEMADENRRLHTEVARTNSQMSVVNEQLQKLLANKNMQVLRDEASLDIAQEVLQQLPWPIIGMDDERNVALANAAADELCGGIPLLGRSMEAALPAQLLAAIGSSSMAKGDVDINGICYRMRCSSMGERSRSRGTLVMLMPLEAAS